MIKFLFSWKNNPNLTEEQCDRHYLTIHTELAKRALKDAPGLIRYVQNKVVRYTIINYNQCDNPIEAKPDFDRFVELYFDDKESMERAFSTPEIKACFDDHRNFMDTSIPESLKIYEVIEGIPLER
jgi:uncharacterized protein (TIGR02118 family)